jgi:hypothetical protein
MISVLVVPLPFVVGLYLGTLKDQTLIQEQDNAMVTTVTLLEKEQLIKLLKSVINKLKKLIEDGIAILLELMLGVELIMDPVMSRLEMV